MSNETSTLDTTVKPVRLADVLNMPKRRGVVMRAHGISDSYGKRYYRMPSGSLRRAEVRES